MLCYQFVIKTLKTLNDFHVRCIVNKLPNVDGNCSRLAMMDWAVEDQKPIHPSQYHSLLLLFQVLLLV